MNTSEKVAYVKGLAEGLGYDNKSKEGKILTEELPQVNTCHENYFENYIRAYHGEEEFLVKIPETRRVLALMDAVRESGRTGKSIDFE